MYHAVIVDDDHWAVEDIKESFQFERWGFEVSAAYASAEEALPALLRRPPELVVSDIRLGAMNGLDLICACRSKGVRSIFIIVSGYDDFSYVQDAFRYGVFFYLLKPLDDDKVEELMQLVSEKLRQENAGELLPKTEKQDSITKAIKYIDAHFTEQITLETVAEHVYLNATYLSQMLSKRLGVPFIHYRNGLRIGYAKQLICAGCDNMTYIAGKVGFESSSQFSRVFKQYEGVSPQQFSKQQAGT